MDHILGARDTNTTQGHAARSGSFKAGGTGQPGGNNGGGMHCTPAGGAVSSAWSDGRPSPLTQQRSTMQTPGTPSALHQGPTPGAAHLIDDASSRGVTPEWSSAAVASAPARSAAGQQQQQQDQQQQVPVAAASRPGSGQLSASRPNSAASSAAVDVDDVRRLVSTVEALQRQLAVRNDRIKQMRAALEAASANGASFTPASSRPGSAAAAGRGGSEALQQRLEAAQQQVESLRALSANLERQLSDAQQAQQAVQTQLLAANRQLWALLPADGSSGSRPSSAPGGLPASSGDASGVLRLQAHQFEALVGRLSNAVQQGRRELAAAQQQGSALTLQLASRNALVQALQAQLRTLCRGGSSSGGDGGVAEGTQTNSAFLLAPPAPLSASSTAATGGAEGAGAATEADALGSLDRIVGLWRQACVAKDGQLQQLRQELEQVGALSAAALPTCLPTAVAC